MDILNTMKTRAGYQPLVEDTSSENARIMSQANESLISLQKAGLVSDFSGGLAKASNRSQKDYVVATALSSIFLAASTSRRSYMAQFESIQGFYIIDAVLTSFADDALAPDVTTGDVVTLQSPNKEIQKELDQFQLDVDVDQLINDIIIDLLTNGEYTLRVVVEEGKGITNIVDDVDQKSVIALYESGYPSAFLVNSKKRNNTQSFQLHEPYKYIHFVIGRYKIRVNLNKEFDKIPAEIAKRIPKYARVGRPVLYGVLAKLKELMLLEQLIPATRLNQIATGSIVSVNVAPSTSPKDAFQIAKSFEDLLNSKIGLDRLDGSVSISDVLTVAGRLKVIPSFGDRGTLSQVDVKNNQQLDDLQSVISDTRNLILSSVGFPPELLYGTTETLSKTDLIKRYARYLRKLKAIQYGISNGLTQMAIIHLKNKGFNLTQGDIIVKFRNELVAIDELEKLEYNDAVLQMVKTAFDFLAEVDQNQSTNGLITPKAFKRWVKNSLSSLQTNKGLFMNTDSDEPDFDPDADPHSSAELGPEKAPSFSSEPDPMDPDSEY